MRKSLLAVFLLLNLFGFVSAEQPVDPAKVKFMAERGNAMQMAVLSELYRGGESGLKKDYAEALKWAKESARRGNSLGMYNFAVLYKYGYGMKKDLSKAQEYFTKAASGLERLCSSGNIRAGYALGYMYYNGDGVKADKKKAFKNFELAAEKGDFLAQYNIGMMLASGDGVPKNRKKAVSWLKKAAENKYTPALYQLGVQALLAKPKPDYKEAVKNFAFAAVKDHPDAQYSLGVIYEYGKGTKPDLVKALGWYQKAAALGHKKAIVKLEKIAKNLQGGQNGKK